MPFDSEINTTVTLLDRISALGREIIDLRPKADRLEVAIKECEEAHKELYALLNKLDLTAQGNTGFAGRMTIFLTQMRDRVRKEC